MIDKIQWLGYGSFVIQGPPLIYINPWRVVRSVFHADVILVGHHQYEFCSPADIAKLRGPETRIITNEAVAQEIEDCTIIRPLQSVTIDRAGIKAIPAYSTTDMRFPAEAGGLGFVISLNYYDIYYAGSTEVIPELELVKPDIAILPINGGGILSVEDAVEVVKMMRPRWVIPSHWGGVGENATLVDAQRFKDLVGGRAEVIIPSTTR